MNGKVNGAIEREVTIDAGNVVLDGILQLPPAARAVVVFAHGSGSSRFSPRNQWVASVLRGHGIGTLLIDLLSPTEESIDRVTTRLRFDIPMLADRLAIIGEWVLKGHAGSARTLGYFGASTGAAAALVAAARQGQAVAAVVSRGGRVDLAGDVLARVKAPTLLIVGGEDREVLALNRLAMARLNKRSELLVVPGAGHLFEERDALAKVAAAATEWFVAGFYMASEAAEPARR